jgi:signal transduction histidine kinase
VIGMSERAQRAGGSLRLSSQVGRGTLVRLRVPERLPISSQVSDTRSG